MPKAAASRRIPNFSPVFSDLFISIPESQFRADISSTAVRKAALGEAD